MFKHLSALPNRQRGFTLIELLVVIAIIGILASTVLASLQNARSSARDAKRISEAKQVQNALEIYRNKNDNKYPCQNNTPLQNGTCPNQNSFLTDPDVLLRDTALLTALGYAPTLDPVIPTAIIYRSVPNRTNYSILVRLEESRPNADGVLSNRCRIDYQAPTGLFPTYTSGGNTITISPC